jgi:hypothetical protein
MVMGLGFRSDSNLHRAQKWPIQSADRSTGTVAGAGQGFWQDLVRNGSIMFCTMTENGRGGEAKFDAHQAFPKKPKPTQLRNEAQLNCVSLRSQLDYEVTWGAVRGQDKRPLRGRP